MSIDVNQLNAPGVYAASREAAIARLQVMMQRGVERAKRVIKLVQTIMPKDYVVKAGVLGFMPGQEGVLMSFPSTKDSTERLEFRLHTNALKQLLLEVEYPYSFALKLHGYKDWGIPYLVEGIEMLYRAKTDLFLLRVVGDDVRAVLSNRYKRLDSAPLVDAFCQACESIGAKPYEGFVSDTQISIQAILPKMYEPIPGELIAYGVSFKNSDFGNGAMSVSIFIVRANSGMGMVGGSKLRKVHLGKRLEEEIEWSENTRQQDIKLTCSVIKDLVEGQLSNDRLEKAQAAIKTLATTTIGDKQSVQDILKKLLSKADIDKIIEKYNAPDVQELPPGNTMWRLVNAVSWLANNETDEDRKMELQEIAGKLLPID